MKSAADFVVADDVEDGLVQVVELLEQRCPRLQLGLGNLLKDCVSANEPWSHGYRLGGS
jgi:hypothetical protein